MEKARVYLGNCAYNRPFDDKREAIGLWEHIAVFACPPNEKILGTGKRMQGLGIKPKDALNLACAIESGCRYFITTDK